MDEVRSSEQVQGLGLGENAVIDTQSDASTRTASQENSQKRTKSDREQVLVRKRDSFNSKARPVSTTSIDSNGLHTQGSVKRKDARPPIIMERAQSTASLESAGSSSNSQPRFQRRQHASTEGTTPSCESRKEVSPESSISSYSADITFHSPGSSITCSFECDLRHKKLEERVKVLEQIIMNTPLSVDKPSSSDQECHLDVSRCAKFTTDRECVSEVKMPIKLRDKKMSYSMPFFSDRDDYGYQMCILMNVQDCEAQICDADLSFSLVIMRGKHDKQLPWPFSRKVNLSFLSETKSGTKMKSLTRVVNPKSDKRHEHPKSDRKYERPKSDLNKPIPFLNTRYEKLVRDGLINDDMIVFSVTVN